MTIFFVDSSRDVFGIRDDKNEDCQNIFLDHPTNHCARVLYFSGPTIGGVTNFTIVEMKFISFVRPRVLFAIPPASADKVLTERFRTVAAIQLDGSSLEAHVKLLNSILTKEVRELK
ncbi:MAG: hypothetical protein ACOX2O_04845 [Bdellovibrionota bacterium]